MFQGGRHEQEDPQERQAGEEAQHGRNRPAEEDRGNRLAAHFRRDHQSGGSRCLRGEQRRADRGDHARRQQGAVTGCEGSDDMHRRIQHQRCREQFAALDGAGPAREERAGDADRHRKGRDDHADRRRRHGKVGTQFIEHAGHDHHAGADGKVAESKRPQPGLHDIVCKRKEANDVTRKCKMPQTAADAYSCRCNASGFSTFFGVPLAKSTMFWKAARKYNS
jgi:hypothetical protein